MLVVQIQAIADNDGDGMLIFGLDFFFWGGGAFALQQTHLLFVQYYVVIKIRVQYLILIQHYCSTVTKQKLKVATVSMANHSGNTIAEARKNRNKVGSCELKLAEEKNA